MSGCGCTVGLGLGPGGGGLGAGPGGAMPLGGGFLLPTTVCLEECRALTLNSIRVRFSDTVQMSDRSSAGDALNINNYALTPLSPFDAYVPFVQWVISLDAFTVQIFFDGELQPGATYRIEALNITTPWPDCQTLDPLCSACVFDALIPEPAMNAIQTNDALRTDVANPQLPRDRKEPGGPLGSFQINSKGDIAVEDNPSYLRKRILRRATTGAGEFFHLPGYGFGPSLGAPLKPGVLRRIQAAAIRQIKQEPDVAAVSVKVRQASPQNPNLVLLLIEVRTTDGRTESFTAPLDYGNS